jgi:hypothetical protein
MFRALLVAIEIEAVVVMIAVVVGYAIRTFVTG